MRTFWYFTTITECPVCGFWDEIRERRYTPKPDDAEDRYEYTQFYDGCNE